MVEQRPAFLKTQQAVRYAPVAGAFPSFGVGQVEVIVKQIGLQSLHGPMDHLPAIFGLLQCSQSYIPTGPEKMLRALIEGVVNLPDREEVLLNDRVTRVRKFGIHVVHNVHRA